jgi:hypothetical protein
MVNKVENIDLTGGSLLSGAAKKKAKKTKVAKSRSASKTKKSKVTKSKSRSRSALRGAAKKKARTSKSRSGSRVKKTKAAKSRSGSKTKKSKVVKSMMDSHKLADNLIQLGVQLKNQTVEGGVKHKPKAHKPAKKSHSSSILLA